MTEKPDYMQKAWEFLGANRHILGTTEVINGIARTLEALDTERAAQEATNAELQALREGLADRRALNTIIARHFKPLVPDLPDLVLAGNRLCDDIQALIQPEPDPLGEVARYVLAEGSPEDAIPPVIAYAKPSPATA